jgi:hypothetical protein
MSGRLVFVLRILFLILLTIGLLPSAQAQKGESPALKSLMTPEDFSSSGLDKLTDAERAHLSAWVARYRQGAVAGPAPPKTTEQRAEEKEVEIVAKVVPGLSGWSGKTVFRLDNGQVWQQRQAGNFRYQGDDSTVVISQNFLGMYVLKHLESERAIGVKRIR